MSDALIALSKRVETVEVENRRLRRTVKVLTTSIVAMVTVAVAGGAFQNVGRFEKALEVVDANGVLRSVLFADDNGGKSGLEIRDPQGRARLAVHTHQNDDPLLSMSDAKGNERIVFGIGPNGQAIFVIKDGKGNVHHNLSVAF